MNLFFLLVFGEVISCLLAGRILLHYFQLESYQFPGYFRSLRRNLLKALLPGFSVMIILMVLLLLNNFFLLSVSWYMYSLYAFVLIAGGWLFSRLYSEKKAKKAFVLTSRIKRLYVVAFVVLSAILLLTSDFIKTTVPESGTSQRSATAFLIVFPALLPLWIALAGLFAWPVEKGISELYFRDAQRILKSRTDLIRIGITGSWGKTSVKFILGTILEEKYHTLVTPASYNTPMGVTKVIRSALEPSHKVFVAEMGARHVGDIREMCRLVHPEIGILTSIGPQHLDTFNTIKKKKKTKYELIEALPKNGEAFFADDDGICRHMFEKTEMKKVISGLDRTFDDLWAENVRYSPEGSTFDLCTKQERIVCSTKLLGELNIRNILLCASVAMSLGLTAEQIARGIASIRPIDHRLQLIRNPGGISVIDDAFNSNIRGAEQAFRVLKDFPGRRVIVTPGMVELGNQEYEMNKKFGALMADCCDDVILIGKKRSRAIEEGFRLAGGTDKKVHVVASLDDATALLGQLISTGDTVLFENDLPDNYTE